MGIKRYSDWPKRLEKFIDKRRNMPFRWGSNDCCLFVAHAVLEMTGVNMLGYLKGQWKTKKGAIELLERFEIADWQPLMEGRFAHHGLEVVIPSLARRGDIVLIETAYGKGVGICYFNKILCPGPKGLDMISIKLGLKAWRLD